MTHSADVTPRQFTEAYLRLFYGSLNLSEIEFNVLVEIVYRYVLLLNDNVKEPYASKLLFSHDSWNEIRTSLKLSSQSMSNYKKSFTAKGLFIGDTDIRLPNYLIPQEEITFKFNVMYDRA